MAETSDITGLITICRRAGKLVMGMDEVKAACRAGKACGVITVCDLSPKSFKEIAFTCAEETVPLYKTDMTMDDMGAALGKVYGIIAIADKGFMKAAAKKLTPVRLDDTY